MQLSPATEDVTTTRVCSQAGKAPGIWGHVPVPLSRAPLLLSQFSSSQLHVGTRSTKAAQPWMLRVSVQTGRSDTQLPTEASPPF